jgi:hypothetical protein
MKIKSLLVLLILTFLSCTRKETHSGSGTIIAPRIRNQVMGMAAGFARSKFTDPKETVLDDGKLKISDNGITSLVDPAKIVTGLLDNDSDEDAIATITSYRGNLRIKTEHLILLKVKRKFTLVRVLESDMEIMQIKDRIITAEVPKFPPDSPDYDCNLCKESVKYRFADGNLVKAE